ncbi:MAG: tetratricopeptide repeat protein [Cyanobacteria bacterium TGS_CYA1]|nr:tetratricopeptide repeat protein [Cyanobacteria bacterium TGS_CYA1]
MSRLEQIDTTNIREGGGLLPTTAFSLIEVNGPDAKRFLQAQTTNNVDLLEDGQMQLSALLDRKAKLVANFHLYKIDQDHFTIVSDSYLQKPILEHLDKFCFADKVEFVCIENRKLGYLYGLHSRLLLSSKQTQEHSFFEADCGNIAFAGNDTQYFKFSRTGEEGFLLRMNLSDSDEAESKDEDFQKQMKEKEHLIDVARIEAGIGKFGVDFDCDNLIFETGLDASSVSYTKGCFQGQEVLARVKAQGAPTRALCGLKIKCDDELGVLGELKNKSIDKDGEVIGTITSIANSKLAQGIIALASMKRDYRAPGKTVACKIDGQDATITVSDLPFVQITSPKEFASRMLEQGMNLFAKEPLAVEAKDSKAVFFLRIALLYNPMSLDAYEALGVVLNKKGELDEAIGIMEEMARLNPDSVMAHANLSAFYVEKGWIEKAEEEKAISMSLRMKEIMQESKQKEEAEKKKQEDESDTLKRLEMFKQVLGIDPDDLLANYGTGSCLVDLGRFEESLSFLNKAIEVKPDYTNAYLYLGRAHLGLDDRGGATACLVKGIEVAAKRGDGEPLKAMQILLNGLESKMRS